MGTRAPSGSSAALRQVPLSGPAGGGDWSARRRVCLPPLVLAASGLAAGLAYKPQLVCDVVLAITVAVGSFQAVNSACRVPMGHWKQPRLRRYLRGEVMVGVAGMFALAAIAQWGGSDPIVFTALAICLALNGLGYTLIEEAIFRIVDADDTLQHGTDFVKRITRRWKRRAERGKGPIWSFIAHWLDWSLVRHVSRTRKYIATALASMVILTATCSAALTANPRTYEDAKPDASPPSTATPGKGGTHGAVQGPQSPPVAPAPPPPTAPRHDKQRLKFWDLVCKSRPGSHPDDTELDPRERRLLEALYLGGAGLDRDEVDDPPGASGGCTGPAVVSPPGRTRFVYVVGTDKAGKILSVAVVSRQFGAAIFIAPAAAPVLELIATYGDIGGMRRIDAGSGQIYGVPTPYGTALLVRGRVVQPGPSQLAVPYVALVPGAVSAWFKTMDDLGRWLWPVAAGRERGTTRIDLVPSLAAGLVLRSLFVDPSAHTARVSGQTSKAGPFGRPITSRELQERAKKAP